MSEGRSHDAGPKGPKLLDGVDLRHRPFVLGLHDPIADLADRARDHLGLDLLEERLPQRVRASGMRRPGGSGRSMDGD